MKLHLNPPRFVDQTHPNGLLPRDDRAQACWYYYIVAQGLKEKAVATENQIILEGEAWWTKKYHEQLKGIALLYGIDDPAEIEKFWPHVEAEIHRWNEGRGEAKGLPLPSREYMYLNPHSRNYNEN